MPVTKAKKATSSGLSFGAPPPKRAAKPPREAPAAAPKFDLPSDSDRKVKLADFSGTWLVVYFYPRDSTPGCTREAQDFTKAAAKLRKLGAAVVGISKDSVKSHCSFKEKIGIGFPLLSDPDFDYP